MPEAAPVVDTVKYDPLMRRFELMRNAARTRRCHTQMVLHHQSVGEHTFGALAILDYIAPDCRKEVVMALLYHDAPEAITGDVPAPAKWNSPMLEHALRAVENIIKLEHDIKDNITPEEHQLVKFADIMELVWYGIEELRMGNRGTIPVVQASLQSIRTRSLQEVTDRAAALLRYTELTFEYLGGTTTWRARP